MFKNKLLLILYSLAVIEILTIALYFITTKLLDLDSGIIGIAIIILAFTFAIGFCMPLILYFLYDFKKIIKADFKNGVLISLFLIIPPPCFLFYILSSLHC